jgi:hypothetical protein
MQRRFSTNLGASEKKNSFPSPKSVVAVVVVLGLALAVLAWQAPAISSFFQDVNNSNSDYTTLSLVAGVSQTYHNGDDAYVFSYKLSASDDTGLFYVARNVEATRSYPAVAGAVYSDLGVEMKVSSVTSEMLVLLVKPLPT